MDTMKHISLGCIKGVFTRQVIQALGVVDIDYPDPVVCLVSKSEMALEAVAMENTCAKPLFDSGLVGIVESPPSSDDFGRFAGVALVESGRKTTRVINGFV